MPNYIPHGADFDPAAAYPTYPAQPFPQHPQHPQQHHQQPPSYPLGYPVNALPYAQPHQTPESHAHRSLHYAPQHQLQHHQQYQLPNQGHGHGPPASGSMPPPSSIPDNSFHRQNYAYASAPRTPDRWPLGLTEDQRHLQEQYRQQSQTPQIPPSYHQPSPMITATPTGPVSTFPPPNKARSPPQIKPPPQSQSPQIFPSPPSTTQQSHKPMTATAGKPNPQSISGSPPDSSKPVAASTDPTSLESQRVSALLDLNRVLLFEVVALQNNSKSGPSPAPPQRNPQQTPPTPAADGTSATAPSQTTSDATAAGTKQEGDNSTTAAAATTTTNEGPKDTPTTTNNETPQPAQAQPQPPTATATTNTTNPTANKTLASKEYIEYMRRLQANLAYLASVADRHHKPGNAIPQYPAIMEAPNLPAPPPPPTTHAAGAKEGETGEREDLREIYKRLRDLWPEYKGKSGTPGVPGGVQQQQQQAPPATVASAG
ncbi:MAG: hypothetical protein LQ350_006327 [Teloschistes chrysophthalmus]|nr:MAG: hypothetical protein LQ350_006327 [Niorma chrysophthalma]